MAAWRFLYLKRQVFLLSAKSKQKKGNGTWIPTYSLIRSFKSSFSYFYSLLIDIHSRPQNETPSQNDLHKATVKYFSYTLSDICSRSLLFFFSFLPKKTYRKSTFLKFPNWLVFSVVVWRFFVFATLRMLWKSETKMHKFSLTSKPRDFFFVATEQNW